MRYLKNNKGSMLAVSCVFVFILVSLIFSVNRVYLASSQILHDQNAMDAHMFSVLGLYTDTMDKVSWANKQLKRIGVMSALLVFTPELAPLIEALNFACKGLQEYQDLLLLRLKVYAPVLDLQLRRSNRIGLLPNLHYVVYKRQPSVDLGFINIPGLIEFKNNVFDTACVEHGPFPVSSKVCIKSPSYDDPKTQWFAPTESDWTVKLIYVG